MTRIKIVLTIVLMSAINIIGFDCGAQKPVKLKINNWYGFANESGEKDFEVTFPGHTSHDIYSMMAINIGLCYYEPDDVMYGVEDKLICVVGSNNNFCQNGFQTWTGKYTLRFMIKDGKVLVLCPSIKQITQNGVELLKQKKMSFTDFISTYWYDKDNGDFNETEAHNMDRCENEMARIINMILGLIPVNAKAQDWMYSE